MVTGTTGRGSVTAASRTLYLRYQREPWFVTVGMESGGDLIIYTDGKVPPRVADEIKDGCMGIPVKLMLSGGRPRPAA